MFAIVFALACLYQLSFTYVSSSVESDAEEYANGDYEKEQRYLDSMRSIEVYPVIDYTYNEVKEKEINLGLDLRGGMNVILEVSVKDILQEMTNNTDNPIFVEAIKETDERATNTQADYLTNFFATFEELRTEKGSDVKYSDPQIFGTKDMNDRVGFNADDETIKKEIKADVNAAIENVYTVLRARIDQFGVVQPNVQRLDNSGRILVELPGVKDPDRVKKLLQSTAELEFYNLYDGYEFAQFLGDASAKLKTIVPRPKDFKGGEAGEDLNAESFEDLNIESVPDTMSAEGDTTQENTSSEIAETSEADSLDAALAEGDSTSAVDTWNPLFNVFFPNVNQQNGTFGMGAVIGYAAIKDTAKVNEYLKNPKVRALLKGDMRNTQFLWSAKPVNDEILALYGTRNSRSKEPALSGDVITTASQQFDQGNNPSVSMTMNAQGAAKWQKLTREAAGDPNNENDNKSVAVVLDGLVYSAPRVSGEIPTGNTEITGQFTVQEAQDLANILRAGKLPAPARIIQADIVGPSLGQEAINAGLWSFVIALLVVMLYMVFYYSGAGLASDVALIVNMFFIFGILASLGAVLTLPGIAGIILTIGMAVDANVLIYERIREELSHGKGLRLAIKDGYGNAFSSIIDANVTTLLTGIILYLFGTGPIRGFATTLIIGILTSLFCAIFVTRLIFEARLDAKKVIAFSTNVTRNAFTKFKIDFIGKRKVSYTISGIIIAAGIISLVSRGLNYGVDFVGGRSYQIRFDQPVSPTQLQSSLGEFFVNEEGQKIAPEVKTIGDDNQVIVTTKFKIDETGTEIEDDIKNRLYEGVKGFYQTEPSKEAFFSEATGDGEIGIVAERQVGPTIADDIKTSAIWAILFSLVVIFLYILIRFSKWQFSLGAVVAAFHDVIVVLSFFSIFYGILPFSLEIDQAFIAAVLTVIGYSLNDTVVVFDRIREYMATHIAKRAPMKVVVNQALNSTLSRTVNTSLTTFFVLLVIFLFGGEAIRGFMFALLVGVVVGTYSSLFIATPIMLDTLKKEDLGEEE